MAGRPILTLKDLYPNEIENILRRWFGKVKLREQIIQNNWRGIDFGHFPDTRNDGSIHTPPD
jgi:hypothetical protein